MEAIGEKIHMLLGQRRFGEARAMIMQQLATDPEHPALNAFLGYCLCMEDRGKEALRPAEVAVSVAPEWCFVHYVLAIVYAELEKPKQALAAVDKAIAIDPQNPDYLGFKASVLYREHQWHEAIEWARRGLETDPEHAQCRGILTAANNQLGNHDEVAHLVDETLRRDPEDAMAHANKGWSCLRQGQPKEAGKHFKEALRLKPELEYARAGALEALKARNIAYRWLLAFFFKLGTLPPAAQWGIILGLFFGYRIVREIGQHNPDLQPFVMPLVVGYLAFAYATWVGTHLADCFLVFHPFGRLAMTAKEKRNAAILGATLLLGIAALITSAVEDLPFFKNLGILLVMITIPLVGTLNANTPNARRTAVTMTAAIFALGIAGLLVMPVLYVAAMLLWVVYVWTVGQYVARN